jgi:hypothetical protein
MAAQLRHLAEQARQGHATVRVLPFVAGAHAGMDSALKILMADDGTLIAYKGGPDRGLLIEDSPLAQHYSLVFHQIQTLALPPFASLDLIKATAEEHKARDRTDLRDSCSSSLGQATSFGGMPHTGRPHPGTGAASS